MVTFCRDIPGKKPPGREIPKKSQITKIPGKKFRNLEKSRIPGIKVPDPRNKDPKTKKTEYRGFDKNPEKIPIVRKFFRIFSGFSNPHPDPRDFGIFDLAQNKKS